MIRGMDFRPIYRFIRYLRPYRKEWIAVLILGNATAIFALLNPYLAKLAVDQLVGGKDMRSLVMIGLSGAGIFLFNSLVDNIKDTMDDRVNKRVHLDLNRDLFQHIHRLPLGWFRKRATGEHIYMIENDSGAMANFITGALPQVLWIVPKIILTLAIVFYLDRKMALFSLVLAPFIYLPSYFFGRKIEKIREELVKGSQDIYKMLEEALSHIQLVKAFNRESVSVNKYLDSMIVNMGIDLNSGRWERLSAFVNDLSARGVVGLIGLYGGYQVIRGNMTVGSLTAIIAYLYSLMDLQYSLAGFMRGAMIDSFSFRRVSEILDTEPVIVETKAAKEISFAKGEIEFNNVSFGYDPDRRIIENLSFRIPGGSHIALVGPSGCGKTTMLNMIVRLYDHQSGRITIDGSDVRDMKFASLRGQIGFVLQEPFLWNDNVENNIRYGKPDAAEADLIKAAEMAGVADFIGCLTDGYKTVIGEDACNISEGQKQKIAVARALIMKPRILILDEAMSSMDSLSEERIVDGIKTELAGATVITVSHRLSTVMRSDLVYYFRSPGEMVVGRPNVLFRENPEFADLFASQKKGTAPF